MDITKKEIRVSSLTVSPLPDQTISREVLLEKYAKGTESSIADVRARIAHALAAVEPEDKRARGKSASCRRWKPASFPPAASMSAAGIQMQATLINCFVQPVGDSISEHRRRQARHLHALQQAAETMRRGGGVGYDFSSIRPKGAEVKGTHSRASGPVSYMRVFDRSCETVESAGARRGAQMGVLRCDHPDIEEFIHAKDQGDLSQFQHLGRRHRRLHAGGGERPAKSELVHKARARTRTSMDAGALPARRRAVGLPQAARARAVGPDHALDLRSRRAGHPVPRPHEPRQQPVLLRDHRGDQSLRRAAAAALRLLLPGLDQPDATSSRDPFTAEGRIRFRALRRDGARLRCACSTTCSTSPPGRCRSSTKRR